MQFYIERIRSSVQELVALIDISLKLKCEWIELFDQLQTLHYT